MSSKTLIAELEHEKVSTLKLLQRLPEDKLTWKPHAKAMTLGQLALHVATIPGNIITFADEGTTRAEVLTDHPLCESKAEILEKFDRSITKAFALSNAITDSWRSQNWTCTLHDKTIIEWPRPILLRFLMLNHWYHHRGQLSVYLRILGVDLPSIYGPSADENPFV